MIKLNYKVFGEGQPLIILHGLFGSLDNWQTMAKRIAEKGFQVFIVDQRNHGKSPHTAEMSLELMANDLSQFMEEQRLNSAIIIGHSMGGKVAMTFANLFPQKVTKLTVVDIAHRAYGDGHSKHFAAMNEVGLTTLTKRSDADVTLKKYISEIGVRQFILKNLSRGEDGFSWKFNLQALQENYAAITAGISFEVESTIQTLFIRGEKSNYISDDDQDVIRSQYSDVQFVTVPNAGHWVHAENADGFFEALIYFLRTDPISN